MTRLYIIFGILGYTIPAIIVARVFFFSTLEKMYKKITREVAIDYKLACNRKVLAERQLKENAKGSLQFGMVFVFLLWPAFLIIMLVTDGNPNKKAIARLELQRAELKDSLISLNSLNPKDLPNINTSIRLLEEQLHAVEKELKQYEELQTA